MNKILCVGMGEDEISAEVDVLRTTRKGLNHRGFFGFSFDGPYGLFLIFLSGKAMSMKNKEKIVC